MIHANATERLKNLSKIQDGCSSAEGPTGRQFLSGHRRLYVHIQMHGTRLKL